MLDILEIIKNEVIDDEFVSRCKDLVSQTGCETTIVLVCNSAVRERHLMTVPTAIMCADCYRQAVQYIARRVDADAIVSVVTSSRVIKGSRCMTIAVETLFDCYAMVYPYSRAGGKTTWRDPRQMELPARFGELLPKPEGMAQA